MSKRCAANETRSGHSTAVALRSRALQPVAGTPFPSVSNQALQRHFQNPPAPAPAGGAPQAQPKKSGTLEFTGTPQAVSLDQPGLSSSGESVDTHAHRPQISWPVRVKQTGSLADCLVVGFLQTITQNDIRATYSPSGRCQWDLKSLPMRDGYASSPVWFQATSAMGQGHAMLGTCQLTTDPLPPGLSPKSTNAEVHVAMTDDPGGYVPIKHPDDASKTLSAIHEAVTFHTWLAVRSQQASETNAASYRFLQHVEWTVRRDMTIQQKASGTGAVLTTNETRIVTVEDGKGSLTPNLGADVANQSVTRSCT